MEESATRRVRRVTLIDGFISEADSSQHVLVSDTGNDQTLLTNSWRIIRQTGREVMMTGAFAGRSMGEIFPVVSAVAKLIGEDGREFAAYAHEALYDSNPEQKESLLSVHQSLRDINNGIDDRARCEHDIHGNPGMQMARFGTTKVPFFFDGTRCFFEIHPISDDELNQLPKITLTDGSVPFEPFDRLHSRRCQTKDNDLFEWKRRLGFVPTHVVSRTLSATTQMVKSVESETREIMRDHFQTRFPELKVRRVNDICYVDTFFSSIPSIRGFTCWNLFCFKQTGLDMIYLMRRRSQSPTTLPRMITDCGAPTVMKSDNAPEFKGKRWTSYLESLSVASQYTEAHHPNQNLAERRGGALKAATIHLLKITGAPLPYWCFAIEYVCLLRSVLARRSLDWMTPHERHWGERPDISVFRFTFWEPIWYYAPRQAFPKPKMLKGRFLGIAPNVGDAFCFLVLTDPEGDGLDHLPQVLARSVIRRRFLRATPADSSTDPDLNQESGECATISFYMNDERTVLQDPPASAEECDNVDDIIPPPSELCVTTSTTTDSDLDAPVDDGIYEVYGPPVKRPRLLTAPTDPATLDLPALTNQPRATDSEEQTTVLLTNTPTLTTTNSAITPLPMSNEDPAPYKPTTPYYKVAPTSPVNTITAHPDDDRSVVGTTHTNGDNGGVVVTQDEDISPSVLDDITHHLSQIADDSTDDESFSGIEGHEWHDGVLTFRVKWATGDFSTVPFTLLKRDYPSETALYILENKVSPTGSRFTNGRYTRWARQYTRQVNRIIRRLIRLNDGVAATADSKQSLMISTNMIGGTRLIRRVVHPVGKPGGGRKRKKPGRLSRGPVQMKYGVVVPQNVRHAYELDKESGTTFWADAIKKEIDSLLALECFSFHHPGYKPNSEYQFAKLSMIFEVKQDGRRKARLVAGGHMIDPMGINSRSTVVKGISVRLLDLVAHRDSLQILCGDIGNAFITADCLEKVYSRAGPEFGDKEESVLVFKKALYGLRSSSRAFRGHFADFLRGMGFSACRYDRDVWLREREERDGYDYVCTHVDDFKIVARNPDRWKTQISAAFLLKSIGPPAYYLGNDYNFSVGENAWVVGCATYIKECIRRVESEFDLDGDLWTHRTPLPESCHPELDDSAFLPELGIRRYQTLIGMAQWACTIGRLDIAFAVSSLSRFSAAPRVHHLELVFHLFGYLKKNPNRRIVMDSRPLVVDAELQTDSFHPDFLEDYPDATEDIDEALPTPYGCELETSVFFDADHAHDHVTRRSISGIIVFVGSTPVLWQSKRQGCIATSTYCAEFVSMRSAVEEAISIRYMLRCLGVPITKPTNLYGDNFGVIQSAEIPEGELKKKHIAISYHYVREAITAKIVNARWCRSHENFADVCTKALGTTVFMDLVTDLMA